MNEEKITNIIQKFVDQLNEAELYQTEAMAVASSLFTRVAECTKQPDEFLDAYLAYVKRKLKKVHKEEKLPKGE